MPALRRADLDPDPITQFERWFEVAAEAAPLAEAMTLATVDGDGAPDARMVLLKGFDRRGFRFFSNFESAKGKQLAATPRAALVFYWRELDRQVRVRGTVERLAEAESDEYFASRSRESQLGAWASPQSRPVESREALDVEFGATEARFAEAEVPRPAHWGGYLLEPKAIEFWQGRVGRLHDRFLYTRAGSDWEIQRIGP